METLDEGPFKAAWRELESQVVELCAYYDPRAPQQWLRTQMGPGGNRMRELSSWIDRTTQRAVENDDRFALGILGSWEFLKQRRNELEHAIASDAGLVYHNSQQVRGSYHWTAERLDELTNDTLALTRRMKGFLAFARLARVDLELGGALSLGSGEAHIGGHRPYECEYCGAQFGALSRDLIDKMLEKRAVPSQEVWQLIADNWGFDMTAEETELAVRESTQKRVEQTEEVAELLKGWERGSGEG